VRPTPERFALTPGNDPQARDHAIRDASLCYLSFERGVGVLVGSGFGVGVFVGSALGVGVLVGPVFGVGVLVA
jgi:hypothetical protein